MSSASHFNHQWAIPAMTDFLRCMKLDFFSSLGNVFWKSNFDIPKRIAMKNTILQIRIEENSTQHQSSIGWCLRLKKPAEMGAFSLSHLLGKRGGLMFGGASRQWETKVPNWLWAGERKAITTLQSCKGLDLKALITPQLEICWVMTPPVCHP